MSDKISLGRQGEILARKHLESLGYQFLEANYRAKVGEIDLIFKDKATLVFVEVKARTKLEQGLPEEAVTPRKLAHITKTAQSYILAHDLNQALARIDVVAIEFTSYPPLIRHHQNVTG